MTEDSDPEVPTPADAQPDGNGAEADGAATGERTASQTAERIIDFTLGAALFAAETLDGMVKTASERVREAREKTPSFVQTLREKGRPAREKLLSGVYSTGLLYPSPMGSAEDEIAVLEQRVRDLERQVGDAPQPGIPENAFTPEVLQEQRADVVTEPAAAQGAATDVEPGPSLTAPEDAALSETTPAEAATLDYAEAQYNLTDTAYDVSGEHDGGETTDNTATTAAPAFDVETGETAGETGEETSESETKARKKRGKKSDKDGDAA